MFSRAGDLIGIVSHNITKSGGSEGLGFVVTANTVKKLLIDGTRRWYGLDLLLVTGSIAETLKVPQAGGFLVKQVAKDSVAARMGLKGGNRLGIVEGQQIVVGGDILLSVQGMPVTSNADMVKVVKMLETLKPGDTLHVKVLRDEKPVDLSLKWTGW
jgi:serine protease Do